MVDKFDYELEQELKAIKRREKIYFSVFSVIVALGLFVGWQYFQNQEPSYVTYDQYYAQVNSLATTGGGGCGSSGGGCGSSGAVSGGCCGGNGQASGAPIDTTQVSEDGLAYYIKSTGDKEVEATVTDYGCHIQCDIIKDGNIIKSYNYQNGQFIEM